MIEDFRIPLKFKFPFKNFKNEFVEQLFLRLLANDDSLKEINCKNCDK